MNAKTPDSSSPDCTWCGHPERKHHPTRTETWCVVGIADAHHCDCPGYNPNSLLRARPWLERLFGVQADDDTWRSAAGAISESADTND